MAGNTVEYYLKVYEDKSILIRNGQQESFEEGIPNAKSKERQKRIRTALANGYLDNLIISCKDNPPNDFAQLTQEQVRVLNTLVESLTSEVGRALVGLTILQLCIKTIEPTQSIRLHKSGGRGDNFSWRDGLPMRVLDKNYNTPTLRKHNLIKVNNDGVMMTRSLAENYPYSKVYKAKLRGARDEWLELVEQAETGRMPAEPALQYLILRLLNRASDFEVLAEETIAALKLRMSMAPHSVQDVRNLIWKHISDSSYAARLMEIAMHSLVQALEDLQILEHDVVPLSQMRSANKKHGNLGDIELSDGKLIIEAWDSKYGKPYLRDELEELNDKLESHPEAELAGFVTSASPERLEELTERISDIEMMHNVNIEIMSFADWVTKQTTLASTSGVPEIEVAQAWLIAYTESLAQKRRDQAPIDEPCYDWLLQLKQILENTI